MLPYFPLDTETYALTMNARALPLDRLIEVEPAHYRAEIAAKGRILAADPRYYHQQLPGAEAAIWEALELLLPNMARHHPQHFALDRAGERWRWTNRLLGTETALRPGDPASLPAPPLDWLARQVQEDLLILADDGEAGIPLVAGHLCFGSNWCLDDKLGRSFLDIHAPVPLFAERIGRSSDLLMRRLKVGHPTGRVGWSLTLSPELNAAPALAAGWRRDAAGFTAANAGERCYLRLERQTFSRLPGTRAVLFTIHTYLGPLAATLAADAPTRARRLAATLRTMPPEMRRYKGFDHFVAPLLAYLDGGEVGDN